MVASCKEERVAAQEKYRARVAELDKEHQATVAKLTDQQEIKDEKYVHKNRLFDAKMQLERDYQAVKDQPAQCGVPVQVPPHRHAAHVQVHLR